MRLRREDGQKRSPGAWESADSVWLFYKPIDYQPVGRGAFVCNHWLVEGHLVNRERGLALNDWLETVGLDCEFRTRKDAVAALETALAGAPAEIRKPAGR